MTADRLEEGAPGSYGPDRLHVRIPQPRTADADVPVMQIDCWIAVARDQEHFVAKPWLEFTFGQIKDAVLIRGPMVLCSGKLRQIGKP